jgi:DNA-binding NtrC family response regulator
MESLDGAAQLPQHNIFQIAYYDSLLSTRALLLEQSGYAVSSALGNEQAKAAARSLPPAIDLVLIGFSGTYVQRAAMIHWIKKQHPELPVVALQAHASEKFAEADAVALAERPERWLAAVTACLGPR